MLSLTESYGVAALTGLGWLLPIGAVVGTVLLSVGFTRLLNLFRPRDRKAD